MTDPTPALAGQSVICTGGGSGIGHAVVCALRVAGADVTVLEYDQHKCEQLAASDHALGVVHGDASRAVDNQRLVDTALDRFGRIDTAMTFVGVFDLYTPLTDIPADRFDDAFDEIFRLNVKSPMLTARAALPALRASRGSIVLTLSTSSFYTGRGGTLYVASKFALRGTVKQLAHECAPDVRVNGVAPGGTLGTDLRGLSSLGSHAERLAERPGREDELKARTPLQVALTGRDHAGAYLFLASSAARGMTGEIVRSDGGIGVR